MGRFTDALTKKGATTERRKTWTLGSFHTWRTDGRGPRELLEGLIDQLHDAARRQGRLTPREDIDPFVADPLAAVVGMATVEELERLHARIEDIELAMKIATERLLELEGNAPRAHAVPRSAPAADGGLRQALIRGATVQGYRLRDAKVGRSSRRCYVEQAQGDGQWQVVWAGGHKAGEDARGRALLEGANAALAMAEGRMVPDAEPHEQDTEPPEDREGDDATEDDAP